MGRDQIEFMSGLGHSRFSVAGHDRGARVAYRMALDHPEVVDKLAVLDIVPTGETVSPGVVENSGSASITGIFLAQPAPLPEKLIGADPEWYWRWHTSRGPESIRGFFDP